MIVLYSAFRLFLSALILWTSLRLKRTRSRHARAVAAQVDPERSCLEEIRAEHEEIVLARRIKRLDDRLDSLKKLRDRLASLRGRTLPYALGSADASLAWLADRLGYVDQAVSLIQSWL